jgi:hypothetical protein
MPKLRILRKFLSKERVGSALVVGDVAAVSNGGYRDDPRFVIEVIQHAVVSDAQASPKTMMLPVAVPRVAPSGRSVVVGSGITSDRSYQFLKGLHKIRIIFLFEGLVA